MKRHIHIVVTLMVVMLISIFTGCEGAIGELPKETQGIIKTPEATQLTPDPAVHVNTAEKLNQWKKFQNLLKEDKAAYLEMVSKLKLVREYEAGELHKQAGTLYKYEEDYFFISDTREGYLLTGDPGGKYQMDQVMKLVDVYPRVVVAILPWGTITWDEKDGKDQLELWVLGEKKMSLEINDKDFISLIMYWDYADTELLESGDYIHLTTELENEKFSQVYFIKVDEENLTINSPYVIFPNKWLYHNGGIYHQVGLPGSLRVYDGDKMEYIEYDGVKDFYFEDGELKIIK